MRFTEWGNDKIQANGLLALAAFLMFGEGAF